MNLLANLSTRVIGMIVAGLVVVAVLWGAVHFYTKSRTQAAQARVERAQGDAASTSAKDAIGAVVAAGERETASEELTRTNEKDIRNAKGADVRVDPDVSAAGLRALCRRSAYADSERCRLLVSNPADVEAGRGGR